MGYIYGIRYIGDKSKLTERSRNNLCRRWCYIGQAKNYERRWNTERREGNRNEGGEQSKFYDTLRHFGVENFEWVVLLIVSDDDMDIIEDDYIVKYSLSPNGLNLRRGGKRGEYTKELRDKMSIAGKKRFESLDARQKNRDAQKLAYSNPELRTLQRNIRLAWLKTPTGIQNSENHSEYMNNRTSVQIQQQADSLKEFYKTEAGKKRAADHSKSHSEIMKKSEKAQSHMKKLNDLLAERRKNKPVVIHKCDVCDYTPAKNSKAKLTRHMLGKSHIENAKQSISV
jgi:hypothetical protein